jgi:hypothetical protein
MNKTNMSGPFNSQFIKKMFFPLGLSLTLIGILVAVVLLILSSKVRKDYEKYDYETIQRNGKLINAKIKDVTVRNNITSNGIEPRVILYEYYDDGKINLDNFQTLQIEKVANLRKEDSIKVYVYKGQSVVYNIAPFKISLKLFWILPVLFCLVGLTLLFISRSLR